MATDRPSNPQAKTTAPDGQKTSGQRAEEKARAESYRSNIGSPMSAFDAVQLLDLTHDAILVMDAHGVIRYWNRGAGETFGFPAEEALGRRADELLNTEFTDSRETIEADVLESGVWDGELIHHSRDGRRIVCASRWVAWEEARTGLPYLLEVSREITARKEAEKLAERERKQLTRLHR